MYASGKINHWEYEYDEECKECRVYIDRKEHIAKHADEMSYECDLVYTHKHRKIPEKLQCPCFKCVVKIICLNTCQDYSKIDSKYRHYTDNNGEK